MLPRHAPYSLCASRVTRHHLLSLAPSFLPCYAWSLVGRQAQAAPRSAYTGYPPDRRYIKSSGNGQRAYLSAHSCHNDLSMLNHQCPCCITNDHAASPMSVRRRPRTRSISFLRGLVVSVPLLFFDLILPGLAVAIAAVQIPS